MTAMSKDELAAMPVEFKLNGRDVVGYASETIIQTAQRHGVEIPHLCYKEGMRPDGNCRACVVEVKGERVLAPSCCRYPTQGMEVTTDSPRALASQNVRRSGNGLAPGACSGSAFPGWKPATPASCRSSADLPVHAEDCPDPVAE